MPTQLIIDADSHVTEVPDLWTSRMSKKWGDLVPHTRIDAETGRECWFSGDKNFGPIANTAAVRKGPGGEVRHVISRLDDAVGIEQIHPSAYVAAERVKVLDERGIYAQVLYPNMNFVGNDMNGVVDDPEFRLENIRAYNDWLVEWAAEAPNRLIPIALIPFFDVEEAAKEVLRARELGHRGVAMTGKPQLHGQPYLADRHWDRLWAAVEETGLPVNIHIGAGPEGAAGLANATRIAIEGGMMGAGPRIASELFIDNAISFCDFLNCGVLARFPGLRLVSVEGGMGWVNFILESLDFHFRRFGKVADHPDFEELPSFYFKRQCFVTSWFERFTAHDYERLGGNIMFETDYPHTTSLLPDEMAWTLAEGLRALSAEARERVLWRNAAELYAVEVPSAVESTTA